jgi:hypothetical protein
MNVCYIPVSIGELYDKYTILQIKNEKIRDTIKLAIIKKELAYLTPFINKTDLDNDNSNDNSNAIINELKTINEKLWEIEDKIREKEFKKEFDKEFIELARAVYKTNDERNRVKVKIDKILNSEISDIKSYCNYT